MLWSTGSSPSLNVSESELVASPVWSRVWNGRRGFLPAWIARAAYFRERPTHPCFVTCRAVPCGGCERGVREQTHRSMVDKEVRPWSGHPTAR